MEAIRDLLQARELKEETVYQYRNQTATYHIRIYEEDEIIKQYPILCHSNQLGTAIAKNLDLWSRPQHMDLLDLTACVYKVFKINGPVFYLQSLKIIVVIDQLHTQEDIQPSLPLFMLTDEVGGKGRTVVSFDAFDQDNSKKQTGQQ